MAVLYYGSYGQKVRDLQSALNALPPSTLPPLVVDGRLGPKTQARTREFQGNNGLEVDGIVGPKTWAMIEDLLAAIGAAAGVAVTQPSAQVRSITTEILGMDAPNGLVQQAIQPVQLVDVPAYRAAGGKKLLSFTSSPPRVARLGIFAARKGSSAERAVIVVLPDGATPDRVMLGISHGFGQNAWHYETLQWGNPTSPALIHFVLLQHVIKRWAAQTLAARHPTALVHIVRAKGKELGPFANDGAFVREVLEAIAGLTGNAFSFGRVEAFTYSSGINEFNPFLSALAGHVNVTAAYSQDPNPAKNVVRLPGLAVSEFLSGQTGGPRPGFDYLPLGRWKNEVFYEQSNTIGAFKYLHGFAMPQYTLHLGMHLV